MDNSKLKLLAIDDNPDNLTTLKAVVSDALPGVRVLTALNGAQGLELARAEDPDVILLDIVMPGMDGFAVCRALKADKRLRCIPVIFVTALKTDSANRREALAAGAEAFLAKPLDEVELTAQIQAMAKIKAANQMQRLEKEELSALVIERTRELEEELTARHVAELTLQQANQQLEKNQVAMLDLLEDQKAAEAAARQDQALTQSIIQSIPGTFYMIGTDGRYVGWNAYQRDEIVGGTESQMTETYAADTIHPDDRAFITEKITSVLTTGRDETSEARVLLRGGPDFRWLLMTGTRMMLHGSPVLIGIGIDITERKKAEKERASLQNQLLQSQKMESVGRLAGGVAHDFNNMLQVIIGLTDMAIKETLPESKLYGDLLEIRKAGRRSADLTHQLLAFARKQNIIPKVIDLNDTVSGMLKMLQRLIGENIELSWLPSAADMTVLMDPSQIDQLLANLCVNSRDAITEVGKVLVATGTLTADAAYCFLHTDAIPGEYVTLAVRDTGSGMSPETLEHIFEPFFTTKGVGEGTGLGLATVYGIVTQNKGFITIQSESGKGSTFTVYLPRHLGEAERLPASGPASAVLRGHETVLFVEDEPPLLVMGKRMLESLGYRVLTAGLPDEAIALAEKHAGDIHLLLTDVIMPKMNGLDLAARLTLGSPGLKTMFMSGYTADIISKQGLVEEGVHFIQKPFTFQDIATKVREALDSKGRLATINGV